VNKNKVKRREEKAENNKKKRSRNKKKEKPKKFERMVAPVYNFDPKILLEGSANLHGRGLGMGPHIS
jgi:hypothetical protein